MCLSDVECPGTQVCIQEGLNYTSVCDCSPFYGWTGFPECTSLGSAAKVSASVYGLVLLLALAPLCCGVIVSVRHFVLSNPRKDRLQKKGRNTGEKSHRKGCSCQCNAGKATLTLALLGLTGSAVWSGISLIIFVSPQNNNNLAVDIFEGEEKYPQLFQLERSIIVLTLLLATACCLNISIMWIKVVVSTGTVTSRMAKNLNHCRRVVYATECLYASVLIPCFVTGAMEIAILATLPFYLFIVMIYAYARNKLVSLLKILSNSQQASNIHYSWCIKQIQRVRQTSLRIIIGISLTLALALAYAGMFLSSKGWYRFVGTSGSFGPLHLASFGAPIGVWWMSFVVLQYSLQTFRSKRLYHVSLNQQQCAERIPTQSSSPALT